MRALLVFISALLLLCSHHPAHSAGQRELVLTQKEVIEIVQNTAKEFERLYLFPEKASHVSDILGAKLMSGDFHQDFEFGRLKQMLESIIINATNDSNFELVQRVSFSLSRNKVDANQSGSISAQILDNNIGYLALDGDLVFADSTQKIKNAFDYLTGVDAMIIDLRQVDLGTLELAQYIVSYFVEPGTHLADIQFGRDATQPLISPENQAAAHFNRGFPVFILNSAFVAGPWEFLAHTLKHFDKAIIVGEDTIGLGIMTTLVPVSKHANIFLSYAEIKHATTSENWQKWGVVADYQTSADASLETAYELAAEKVQTSKQLPPEGIKVR